MAPAAARRSGLLAAALLLCLCLSDWLVDGAVGIQQAQTAPLAACDPWSVGRDLVGV
jgi:hypothetical protein